ncbi:Fur family transcriptional regulator [Micromonospora sp. WMMD980]|uniref:Fur family transcriptional regulator n=1 Tax=unclassified Micromonospora TaxID=2617518 RepID=UPI00241780CD|nr:Fur family transcriptional regulator [Micromonospora sp. WMMD980]MDG4799993.1 Fur family transcriptional regulator [Micromonospora sp. WMMD980]
MSETTPPAVTPLRAIGVRTTRQRQAILAALTGRTHPMTAQAVHTALTGAGHRIGLSTVYRALHRLTEVGLLHSFEVGGERAYRRCPDTPHQHLLCDDCGLVTECPPHLVEAWLRELREATGFTPHADRIDLHGHCAACPTSPESP